MALLNGNRVTFVLFLCIFAGKNITMLVKVATAALLGIEAKLVQIEVHLSRGIRFSLVGLPDSAVKESHERIVSALQVNGMDLPRKQIVINMSPADLKKEGTSYDLPLLVGIMAAGDYVPSASLEGCMFSGEISLDGYLRPVKGILSVAILARELGYSRMVVPAENAEEASVVEQLKVYGIRHLRELVEFLRNPDAQTPHSPTPEKSFASEALLQADFSDVRGQQPVKRAVEVACAGGHNLLMIGPPGAGKSMIANCIPGILPPMNQREALETTRIHSVAGKTHPNHALLQHRPFRAPHHSISSVALVGGGNKPRPGELSLAHHGVLFLDELPEFNRTALEVLRQPLEEGIIHLSRVNYSVEYPSQVMLVASMNPCPCGFYNHPEKDCICNPGQRQRYLGKISGPLLDRMDLQIEITPVPFESISGEETAESSSSIRERVMKARQIQSLRFGSTQTTCNARMETRQIQQFVALEASGKELLKNAMAKLKLSARAYNRILKVSRTIADLEGQEKITATHVAEAIQYRTLDRDSWGK
jgi:magnesium chelatase family protein